MSRAPIVVAGSVAWLAACSLACTPPAAPDSPHITALGGQPALDVFDLRGSTTDLPALPAQHWRVVWDGLSSQAGVAALASWLTVDALVTVETWHSSPDGGVQALADGEKDDEVDALCRALAGAGPLVYLRWNPEMEVPAGLYPWQNQSPRSYIAAFRRLSVACRRAAPRVRLVWGPAGYPGDLEYFPGAASLDVVSITIDGASEARMTQYPRPGVLVDRLRAKLHRLRFQDAPVFVLAGSAQMAASYRTASLAEALERMSADRTTVYADDLVLDPDHDKWHRRGAPIRLGVYDPGGRLRRHPAVSIEHIFIDWRSIDDGFLQTSLRDAAARGHDAIVTLEPWNGPAGDRDPHVLRNIARGQYDDRLGRLASILAAVDRTVYLRFAHEMEIPVERYPWQRQDPGDYIHAFRHVARAVRTPNVRLVYGPAGDREALAFWPGADVVDDVGLSIYGLPDRDMTDHRWQESFDAILTRKLHRMRFLDKPVLIAELGVMGPADYQRVWLAAAARTIRDHPQIAGVCYFNLEDLPGAWGDIPVPDWSIARSVFTLFADELFRPREAVAPADLGAPRRRVGPVLLDLHPL